MPDSAEQPPDVSEADTTPQKKFSPDAIYYRQAVPKVPEFSYVVNEQQQVQLSTLFQCIAVQDVPAIQRFKKQGFDGIFRAHEPETGNTVMHAAAFKGDTELLGLLLREGSEIDARNRAGVTPVMVAAHHGFVKVVEYLVEKTADVNATDKFGQNVLWYCFGGTERHKIITDFLLNKDVQVASDATGKPVLVRACEKGNKTTDVVELLIQSGSDVNEAAVRTGRTPLIEAARRGAAKTVSLLLAENASPDEVDYRKVHAAHEAAYHGHVAVLQLLAGAGAKLDTPSYNGNTPLHLAVAAQKSLAVRFLSQHGANSNAKNALGLTPKTLAKKYGLKVPAKEMKKAEKQFNSMKDKRFMLEIYEWIQNNLAMLQSALAVRAQENGTISKEDLENVFSVQGPPVTEDDMKKFFEAADPKNTGFINVAEFLKGDKYVPKAFTRTAYEKEESGGGKGGKGKGKKKKKKKKPKLKLPKGMKITIASKDDETDQDPLPFRDNPFIRRHTFFGEEKMVLHGGDKPSTPFSDDLMWILDGIKLDVTHVNSACYKGDFDSLLRACHKGLNVNQCDACFKTPLMYATGAGRWDMVQLLMAYGANPNAVDNFGWTALHHACRQGHVVVADELIRNGAKVNQHTLAGATPLMKAIESSNVECVICCVINGASLKSRTVCGLSVKDYSRSHGNYRIYRVISRFLRSYKGGRYLTKELAAVDPYTKFSFGDQSPVENYMRSVHDTFRKDRLLRQSTLLKTMLQAQEPLQAVKPKAVKNAGHLHLGKHGNMRLDIPTDEGAEKLEQAFCCVTVGVPHTTPLVKQILSLKTEQANTTSQSYAQETIVRRRAHPGSVPARIFSTEMPQTIASFCTHAASAAQPFRHCGVSAKYCCEIGFFPRGKPDLFLASTILVQASGQEHCFVQTADMVFLDEPSISAASKISNQTGMPLPSTRIIVSTAGKPLNSADHSEAKANSDSLRSPVVASTDRKVKAEKTSSDGGMDYRRYSESADQSHLTGEGRLLTLSGQNDVASDQSRTESPEKAATHREQARKFFTDSAKKFEDMQSKDGVAGNRAFPGDQLYFEARKLGRSKQLRVIEARTNVERTAWAIKNHLDVTRGGDLTFYSPAPEDWYPPTRAEMAQRYRMLPGLFDRAIKPQLDEDPFQKYGRKFQSALRSEQKSSKKNTPRLINPLEKIGQKRFSVTEELKRIRNLHPTAMSPGDTAAEIPRMSFMNQFLKGLQKKTPAKSSLTAKLAGVDPGALRKIESVRLAEAVSGELR